MYIRKRGEIRMSRQHANSKSPYASVIGFSRAVRVGNFISVGGTAPIGTDGQIVGINDPAKQTEQRIKIIYTALKEVGATLKMSLEPECC